MEIFSEDHAHLLLSKEWLVKTDNLSSTPYLFKFHCSVDEALCCVLVTNTKSVWAEVLSSKQFARRWRESNGLGVDSMLNSAMEEEAWRRFHFNILSMAHTLGGVMDLAFTIAESNYSDLCFQLEGEGFKWKWETFFLGFRRSADIISKHLILPLISVNHLAFNSTEVVGEISATDMEKAVDKVGRTARRMIDTHLKNTISKPRVASSLRRMTAMLNSLPDLPAIFTAVEKPTLQAEFPHSKDQRRSDTPPARLPPNSADPTSMANTPPNLSSERPKKAMLSTANVDSATDSDTSEPNMIVDSPILQATRLPSQEAPTNVNDLDQVPAPSSAAAILAAPKSPDPGSGLIPPAKKAKKTPASSSDEDSEEERKRRVAQLKAGTGAGVQRGARQPIKRGGKRF
ncbi:hypothetical protein BD779DRAFT_572865 [Infundibulicybe gibba]|nr:hypothetical protein BD779DRAFT_572865 [Infundibulicybe gibba]